MNHNDYKRTGWNNKETILTTDNVSNGNFGEIFSRTVDDQIYAQPLVLSNISIGGSSHNIVIVATVSNTVYAFDADNANVCAPYWQVNLSHDSDNYRPVKNSDMTGACTALPNGYTDFTGNIGIVGTPAIDTATNTLYVVARSVSKKGEDFVQYLHAIDITTGAEKLGSPVFITATYPGNGQGNVNGVITFEQQKENQRPGLLLYDGTVYICWASHCDWGPYHGWMLGYDATTLEQKYIYNDTPDGNYGGIWMSGQPPSVDDSGNIYITTGNGTTGKNGDPNNIINRGSSLIKLSTVSDSLKVADFFTPMNYEYLNDEDLDYGIDGALLIPDTHLSLSGSKEGNLFLIDNCNMGHTTTDNSNVLQILNASDSKTSVARHLHGSPVYYQDESGNEYIYAWCEQSLLKQFAFNRNTLLFDTVNTKIGNTALPSGMPGAMLSVSSNASQRGTGILWASHPIHGDANLGNVPGVLQAFDARDVTHELWSSNWNSKRDSIGKFAKFVPPTIANGKVYMATFSNKLNVYGLNPPSASVCSSTLPPLWQSADIGYVAFPGDVCVNNDTFSITASGDDVWNKADAFHFVFQKVLTNETEITVRVASIKNTNSNAKCGVMFRENLDAGSPYVFLNLTPYKIEFQERALQSTNAVNLFTPISTTAPYWLRIYNKGNKYISYYSDNRYDWTALDSVLLALGSNPYVGIAYTTRNNSVLDTALVDNVSLTAAGVLTGSILNFNAKNINDKYSLISWTTSTEANEHFEIQHSTSNTDFVTINTIEGNGQTSELHNYSFTHDCPSDGMNYYRIKVVDKNGNSSYSSIASVRFNFRKIRIFPNPAHHTIYIANNKNYSNGDFLKIQLLDFSGKLLYKQVSKTNANEVITVNLPPTIPDGLYLIIVTNYKGYKQGDKVWITK